MCGWEDDPHQSRHPNSADGANGRSLIDRQQPYRGSRALARLSDALLVFVTGVEEGVEVRVRLENAVADE